MAVNQQFLQTLKDKLNIVEVASGYLHLEKKGATYWACCPFHHEKTPSFALNENEQYYHCFGCGASGDIIKFVSEMETLDFMDTVKILAEKAKLPMPETEEDNDKTAQLKKKRDTLLKLMKDVAHFYLNNLNSGNADAHIEYILKRKIPSNIVRKFGLGASINFNDLPRFLLQKGYSKEDMLDSGTVNEVDGKLIDAQGGRLIFPIINALDEVIAFGGRALKKTDFAKYKNTKETLIFNKSKTLYNVNLLKKLKRSQTIKEVIMVEGYMDTISLYEAGFKNVVASMGTSLTQDQARLIKRYTDTVLISYDADGAGQKANLRGLEILKEAGINVKVVPLPDGLDPDDVIKQMGPEGYQKCLDSAMPLIDYKLSVLKKGVNLSKTEEKRKYVADAINIIRSSENAAEQEDLLKRLREETGVTFEALKRQLLSLPEKIEPKKEAVKPVRQDTSYMQLKASRFVIASLLFGAKYAADTDITEIPFEGDVHPLIARYILSKRLLEEEVHVRELFDIFEQNTPEFEEITKILDFSEGDNLSGEVAVKYFADCIKQLKLFDIDKQIAQIKSEIKNCSDVMEQAVLASGLTNLIKLKAKIKNGVQ